MELKGVVIAIPYVVCKIKIIERTASNNIYYPFIRYGLIERVCKPNL